MHWSAEEFVLVITAFLFLTIVASSFLPRVELTSMSRATFAIGAAAFIGSAALLAGIEDVHFPLFLWAMPAVPAVIMGVMVRDAISRPTQLPASTESVAQVRRSSAYLAPDEQAGSRATAVLRERASSPHATAQELASIAFAHPEIRATIAGNPATSASLLEWLAASGDTTVHAAISAREPAPAARPISV